MFIDDNSMDYDSTESVDDKSTLSDSLLGDESGDSFPNGVDMSSEGVELSEFDSDGMWGTYSSHAHTSFGSNLITRGAFPSEGALDCDGLGSFDTLSTNAHNIQRLEFEPDSGYHPSFGISGYTQSEINNHISEAKHNIADAESDIRHHTSIANSKARMGEPHSFEDSQIRSAQSRLNDAKSDLNKWQHMKPSK